MGLFKRPTPKVAPIENDDFNPLDLNSLIAYIKQQKPDATAEEVAHFISELAKPVDDLEHLDANGELPWGWFTANKVFIENIEAEYRRFLNAWLDIRNKDVLKEYAALKSLVLYIGDVRKLCASKGECYEKWFSDCVADQKYFDKCSAELKRMEESMDALLEEEARKRDIEQNVVPNLRGTLLETITKESGILQTQLYERFDADVKSYISSELYEMEKSGLIRREKSGRTYKLIPR